MQPTTESLLADRDNMESVTQLIELWQPLVTRLIYKYGSNCDHELKRDLRQAGNLGLLKAIQVFDAAKASFCTCAFYYIRKELQQAIYKAFTIKIYDRKRKEGYKGDIVSIDVSGFDSDLLEAAKDSLILSRDAKNKEKLARDIISWVNKNFSEQKSKMFIAAHLDGLTNKQINKKFGIATAGPQLRYIRKRVREIFRERAR